MHMKSRKRFHVRWRHGQVCCEKARQTRMRFCEIAKKHRKLCFFTIFWSCRHLPSFFGFLKSKKSRNLRDGAFFRANSIELQRNSIKECDSRLHYCGEKKEKVKSKLQFGTLKPIKIGKKPLYWWLFFFFLQKTEENRRKKAPSQWLEKVTIQSAMKTKKQCCNTVFSSLAIFRGLHCPKRAILHKSRLFNF